MPTRSAVTLLTIGPKNKGERYSRPSTLHDERRRRSAGHWMVGCHYDSGFLLPQKEPPVPYEKEDGLAPKSALKFLRKCPIPAGHRIPDPPPRSVVAIPTTLPWLHLTRKTNKDLFTQNNVYSGPVLHERITWP